MKRILIISLLIALSGCAATGVKITDDQVKQFKVGESTADQVVTKLGQPTTKTKSSDGSFTFQYVYAEATVRGASFIPIVGIFAGGSDVRSNVVKMVFNSNGTLKETTSTESQYGTGIGGAAGNVSSDQVDQPKQ